MLIYPLHALLLGSSSVAVTAKAAHHRNRNLPNQKEFEKEFYGTSKHSAALRKKFVSKSKFVGGRKLQNNGYYSNGYYAANKNNNNNNYYNFNYNYNNGEAEQASEVDADGEEYTYDEDGNRVYKDAFGEFDGYAFNPSNYAMAYHRCASVKQFDTDVASEEDAEVVFTTKTFAIFRFCPVDSCDEYTEEAEEEEEASDDAASDDAASDDAARRLDGDDAAADDAAAAEEDSTEEEDENAYNNADMSKYGARGKGCKKNYGEYMIELQDYLEIMMEYQEGRLTTYCKECEQYMYEMYMDNYDDYVASGNYDDKVDDDGGRKLFSFSSSSSKATYEEFKSDPASHRMLGDNYSLCRQYPNICGTDREYEEGSDVEEYMQCTQAGDEFIGPHCSDDGFTITLGAHSDDECTEYIGDVAESNDDDDDGGDDDAGGDDDNDDDAADADGEFDIMSYVNSRHGGLSLLYKEQESSMCIPCSQDDDFSFEDNDDGNGGGGGMSELCQQLYESSAHCERNYQTFNKKYLTDAQWKNVQLSCSYMDSIVMGNYDEMGYVNFKWRWGLWGNNNYKNKEGADGNTLNAATYAATSRRVSALQVFFLVFTCLSCAILGVWAKTLHTSLRKKAPTSLTKSEPEPWSPRGAGGWNMRNMLRRKRVQEQQPQVGPSDSGIGASRVRSDNSAYYLS